MKQEVKPSGTLLQKFFVKGKGLLKTVYTPKPTLLVEPDAWQCTIEKWDIIGKDSAALMLHLAEQRLTETVTASDSMSKKAEIIISILIPFLTVLIGFILSRDATAFDKDALGLAALFCIIPVCASLYFIQRNFRPYRITVPGESPQNIATARNFDNDLTTDEKYYNLVLNQLGSYQDRILTNEEINSTRVENIRLALFCMMFIPIAPLLAFLLVFLSGLVNF
ncbi:hypothetical protein [Pontibacter burrus]|uniref:Uncharacterized protein n=1 Tax=Pontibacter burrus TaxID=2704466 RepID=A0A6B3LGJ7_9BACT|nr:hypothetical protein [Pontibacter burrus]NEM96202.1 hypothetical protein [Pontibacter burrus]